MDRTIVETYLKKIYESMFESVSVIGGWKYRLADYVSQGEYEMKSEWREVTGKEVFPSGITVLMETSWKVPEVIHKNIAAIDYLFLKVNDFEGLVSINGKPYQGIDMNRDRLLLAEWMKGKILKISLELYDRIKSADIFEKPMLIASYTAAVNQKIESFYYDLKVAWETLPHIENEFCRKKVENAICSSLRFLDLTQERKLYIKEIEKAGYILDEAIEQINHDGMLGRISLIGHTHIDMAWLWQWKETVRKCSRTFSNVLRLMEEFPEFKFSCSQPQLYEYVKENYPDIYMGIKKYVKEGRWEIVGPMWIEPDCNLVSGESLVRQILYGQIYFKKEFAKESPVCWLPDTFGFQGNMPQILKKCGVDYFFTYKLHWQSQNRFPFEVFKWKGIDGTEIISAVPMLKSGYNGKPWPDEIRYAQDQNLQKDLTDEVIFPYGYGDGGGGPTREMIEYGTRLQKFPGMPECSLDHVSDYFGRLEKLKNDLPVWFGELYLETHRGTYTTQGMAKKLNRKCEQMLRQIEIIGVIAEMKGKKADWENVKKLWKKMLMLQFHDILPGSSIIEVYDDAARMYAEIIQCGEDVLNQGLKYVSGDDGCITVFNLLSWERDGIAEIGLDREGNEVPDLVIQDEDGQKIDFALSMDENGRWMLMFTAERVPSMGIKKYSISISSGRDNNYASEEHAAACIHKISNVICVENRFFSISIAEDGTLLKLFDKRNKRDVVAENERCNRFRLFMDGPQKEDAWNIYPEYREREVEAEWTSKCAIKENNDVRTVVSVTNTTDRITILQDIVLYTKLDRIDFITKVDWEQSHKVLKAEFPVEILSPLATYEIGFGAIQRPTYENNPWEKSQFEVSGHRWVDLSEGCYGVSLLNDCKYGYDIKGNTMSITLLRGTEYPGIAVDRGIHMFTYSIYPHKGEWRHGMTVKRGSELNSPLLCAAPSLVSCRQNELLTVGEKESYICLDRYNVVLDTIKPAEDGNGIILRFYECNGDRTCTIAKTSFQIAKIFECSMLEIDFSEVKCEDNSFSFSIKPFEVLTFRVIHKR
jgi:alpha-mannosidase